jgi:NAD+ kinase
MAFQRIGIWGNTKKMGTRSLAETLIEWLEARGCTVVLAEELAGHLGRAGDGVDENRLGESIDLVVCLGGDGSLLYTARLVADRGVPILGVNLGRLGFLAEIAPGEVLETLGRVFDGDCVIDERLNLEAVLFRNGNEVASFQALNDVVVDRGASPRVLEFEIRVDGVHVTTYAGDGVILATPTGSTGHSLSAGGPVVNPGTRALIISPICAHSLASPSIIVSDREEIEVRIHSAEPESRLSVDGQVGHPITNNDQLRVRAASQVTRLVRQSDTSFYEILRTKFRWENPRLNGDQ